ncbi:MAG TPA: carbohydrate porin, partial [Planctomycetota bacterium]|nr:carbohydrate porin [Planctomycetota bacterium]
LSDKGENEMSFTATLFLGRRLWEGAGLYLDPEVSGGSGLSGTTGLAAFPNGEITRVSVVKPIPYIARLYLEQTIDLGGADVKLEPGPNQLGGHTSDTHLTLRAGKFSAVDMFDDNKYSHDPREQFLNWALMDNGAWDYPADTRGYTGGLAAELQLKEWTLRYGFFLMPKVANGLPIDFTFQDAHGQAVEIDRAHVLFERPGTLRAMLYVNNADMGNYRNTIDTPAFNMDITQSRGRDRMKYGFTFNGEQEWTDDLGAFFRAGWNDGRTESFAFTEIDRTFTLGAALKGTSWQRPLDTVAAAIVVNGLSPDHAAYLAKGGRGFIVGDGALHYGPETLVEAYYQILFKENLALTFDYQFVANPGYNRDRGPVPSIWAIRVHVTF